MAEGINSFVTAVLVTHDGATWLPKVIAALGSQSRKIDRVVAVDTGSIDNSTKLLQSAGIPFFVEDRDMGYGDAIEHALELTPPITDGSQEWIWLIHDDCAPDKNTLEELLAAVQDRPQVAIAGPKLRGWYDREHLLEIGVSIANNGARWTGLEQREQDQGQHDGIREVLAVSTAASLIRRDIYEELGGLDINLALFRDDVDFGWRAYVAGYSAIAVPSALAYHAEASASERRTVDVSEAFLHRPLLLDRRNAAYVMLVNSSWWLLPWISIQLLGTSMARAIANLLMKLPGYAGDEIAAVGLLLINPKELIQARQYRKKKRLVSSRIIRRFIPPRWSQFRMGSESLFAYFSDLIRPSDDTDAKNLARSEKAETSALTYSDIGVIGDSFDDPTLLPTKQDAIWKLIARKPHFIIFALITGIALFAGRNRFGTLSGGAMAYPQMSGWDLVREYVDSWHAVGLGSASAIPPWLPVLGIASALTLFNLPLFISLLFVFAPIVAFYTFFKVLSSLGSSKYFALVGAGIYAFSPVMWTSINQGRLGTLAILLIAPSLFVISPFERKTDERSWRAIFAITLLSAILSALNPIILLGWMVLQGYFFITSAVHLRHHFVEMGVLNFFENVISLSLKKRFVLFITPWLLTTPWSITLLLHPTQFLLEPGLPIHSGNRWSTLFVNPGGVGAPPLWIISPILLLALAALTIRELRDASLIATTVIAVAVALSAFTILGHGSSSNIWTGPIIAIASALLLPPALLYAEALIPTLQDENLGVKHFGFALISLVTTFSLVATPIWAITTAPTAPLKANQNQIVPAFVTALAQTPERPKTVIIRNIGGEIVYGVSRGHDLLIGESDVSIPLPGAIGDAITSLVAGSGITSASTLGAYGIQYLFLKGSIDSPLVRTIDGSGGFVRMSSTSNGVVWKISGSLPHVYFKTTRDKQTIYSTIASTDVAAEGDVSSTGEVIVTEKADSGWTLLLDGKKVRRTTGSDGLPHFAITGPGHVLVVHESALHRALLSVQFLTLLIVVVMALPAGRRRKDVPIEELV